MFKHKPDGLYSCTYMYKGIELIIFLEPQKAQKEFFDYVNLKCCEIKTSKVSARPLPNINCHKESLSYMVWLEEATHSND